MSRFTKKTATIAATSAAAVMTLALTATPAQARQADPFTATLDGPMTIQAGISTSCSSSVLKGTVDAAGNLTITSATVDGCGGVPVTAENLPWSGSLSGGVASITGFEMSAIGCNYAGDISGTYPGTPFPVEATFSNQPVDETTGGWFCPPSATVTATYDFTQP